MKMRSFRQRCKHNRNFPVAKFAVFVGLSLVVNASLACSTTVTTLDSAPCNLLTGDSITITNSGSITAPTDANGDNTIAISANGAAATVTNHGSINGYIDIFGNNNGITSIANTGNITGISAVSVSYGGTLTSITNTGTMTGTIYNGIDLFGMGNSNFNLINSNGGQISGAATGNAALWIASTIENINNEVASRIFGESGAAGIYVGGSVNTVTNAGTISGSIGIDINTVGSINAITNSGLIEGTDASGIALFNLGNSTFSLNNSNGGAIFGVGINNAGIYVDTLIDSISNDANSNIEGTLGADGIYVGGSINSVTNAGAISGSIGIDINTLGSIHTIANTGSITGDGNAGVGIYHLGTSNLVLTNSGSITGNGADVAGVWVATTVDNIINSGAITGLTGSSGIVVSGINAGISRGITNSATGVISGDLAAIRAESGGSVGSITNAGTISGVNGTAIDLSSARDATSVTNTGTIDGSVLLGSGTLNLNGSSGAVNGDVSGSGDSTVNVNGLYVSGGNYSVGNFSIASGGALDLEHTLSSTNAVINAGTLNLNLGGDISGAITGGGTLNISTNFSTKGNISAGLLSVEFGNTVDVAHGVTVTSALANAGTLNLDPGASVVGAITGNGTMNVNTDFTTRGNVSAGLLSVASGKTFNAAHAITAANAFDNAGTLNLNAGSSIAGAITGNGAIYFNTDFATQGNIDASLLSLAAGRTLNVAHAVTSTGAINNAGTLSIAAGQTVNAGSYSQSASGVLSVGASSATNHGKLAVAGVADFSASGAIAVNVSAGNTLTNNDVLHIVNAGSLTSPSSYSVTDNNALWSFTAVDNGTNGIDLTAHYSSLTTAIQAANQPAALGVAGALNTIFTGTTPSSMQALANGLNTQTDLVSLGNQVAQLTPVLSGGQGVAALASINAGANSLVQTQLTTSLGLSSGEAMPYQHVWIKPFGATLKQDASASGMPGYKAATSGLAVGTDRKLDVYGLRAGFALSYGGTKVEDSGVNPGSLDITSLQLTGYGINRISDRLQLNLIGALGFNDNKSSRYVPLVATKYTGQYTSWNTLLDAQLEWAYKVSTKTVINPSIHLSYSALRSNAYSESPSGNAALNVDSATTDSVVFGLGAKWVYSLSNQSRLIGHIEVGNDLVDKPSAVTSSFEEGGPSFSTSGTAPSRTVIKTGLAYKQTSTNGMEVTARFDIESRQQFMGNSLSLNWRRPF